MMNRAAGVIAGVMLMAVGAPHASATPIDVPIVINGPGSNPPPPPPQCSLSLNPPMATIPSSTPKGATLSTIVVMNCTGSAIFGPPNFDDGGLFAISGNRVIVNPQGPGVAALGGTTQTATITISP
jgi:hypothetical protein